jgi:hypothetical protein
MNQAQKRLMIALKSPIQAKVDPRPRCEDCGDVLTLSDLRHYWDGPDPYVLGIIPKGESPIPRCCTDCAEGWGLERRGVVPTR